MERDAELDFLLDDALDGFQELKKKPSGARVDGGGTASSSSSAPSDSLAFDPFSDAPSRKKKKEKGALAGKKNSRPRPDDDISEEQLLQGLADDLQSLMAGLGLPVNESGNSSAPSMQATLSALKEQTRSATLDEDAGNNEEEEIDIDSATYAEVLRQLEQMGKEGDISSMLERMMGQLLSKDVLYEPLKEISQRYPSWLAERGPGLSADDTLRYRRQSELVRELVLVYETSPENTVRVMELMQEMQACGTPPQEILQELSPGLEFDEDGSPIFPTGAEGGAGKLSPEFAQQCAQM